MNSDHRSTPLIVFIGPGALGPRLAPSPIQTPNAVEIGRTTTTHSVAQVFIDSFSTAAFTFATSGPSPAHDRRTTIRVDDGSNAERDAIPGGRRFRSTFDNYDRTFGLGPKVKWSGRVS